MLQLLLAVALVAAPGKPHRTKIAVLDVEDVTGSEAAKARLLTQVLVGDLPKLGEFDVLGASEIRSMIGFERQKELLGCKDDSCLAELGGALGVDFLVTGQLGKLGSRYRFDLRLINAAKSRVVASEGDFIAGNDDVLADAVEKMLRKLLADAGMLEPQQLSPAPGSEPAGGLSQSAPSSGPSHTAAWIATGGTVLLAAGATFFTIQAKNRFSDDQQCWQGKLAATSGSCSDSYSPDTSSHLADALWVGTAAMAGVSTYLFLSPSDASGSGGEIGVRGSF